MSNYEEYEVQARYIWRDKTTSEETVGEIELFIRQAGPEKGKPMLPDELEIDGYTYIKEDKIVKTTTPNPKECKNE